MQEDEKIDAIIVVVTPQNMTRPLELAEKLAAAHKGKKPVLAAFMGGTEVAAAKEKLMALGIPNYPSPDRAITALRAMCDYAAWRRRPARVVTRFPVNRRRVDRIIHMQVAQRRDADRRSRGEGNPARLRFQRPRRPACAHRRRSGGNRGADRLSGRVENFVAGHHSQIRFRRRAHQSRQRRAGARRVRSDDGAHSAARAQRASARRRTSRRWASAGAK